MSALFGTEWFVSEAERLKSCSKNKQCKSSIEKLRRRKWTKKGIYVLVKLLFNCLLF